MPSIDALVRKYNDMDINVLRALVSDANTAYHVQDDPIISDAEYDVAFRILNQRLEQSGNQQVTLVGDTVTTGLFPKHIHEHACLSLGNVFDLTEMSRVINRWKQAGGGVVSLINEPKIDGLSLSLYYVDGVLSVGATRGDGSVGEDVTVNIRGMNDIPERIDAGTVMVRGEVYITKADFLEINEELVAKGEKPKANPRNAAAGILRSRSSEYHDRLKFFAYHATGDRFDDLATDGECMDHLDALGFSVPPVTIIDADDASASAVFENMAHIRSTLDYDIDGSVFKVDDKALRQTLGEATRTPNWAIAWKFNAEQAGTFINSVTWQVGRTGVLTPVAELEPVNIGGVIVSRATMHNLRQFQAFDASVRCEVTVQRAGDVIPEIVCVNAPGEDAFVPPSHCPSCGSPVKTEGTDLFCTASDKGTVCHDQMVQSIAYVASRKVLNIQNMGQGVIERLYCENIIRDIPDIFRLLDEGDIRQRFNVVYPGRAGQRIIAGIAEAAKSVPFDRFIAALEIPMISNTSANRLADYYREFEPLFISVSILASENNEQQISILQGIIGNARTQNMLEWSRIPGNIQKMSAMSGLLDIQRMETPDIIASEYNGVSVVFTGSIPGHTRDSIKELAKTLGMNVKSSVSKSLDLLVYGDKAGSGLEKARKLGVKTKDAKEFLQSVVI